MKSARTWWLLGVVPAILAVYLAASAFSQREKPSPVPYIAPPAEPAPVTLGTPPSKQVSLYIELRSNSENGKRVPTVWDGSLSVEGCRLLSVRDWEADPRNIFDGNSWKLTTRHIIPWNTAQRKKGHDLLPLRDVALVVDLAEVTPSAELRFTTAQGDFTIRPAEVAWGEPVKRLEGKVRVQRMAVTSTIVSAATEDDFPAAIAADDGVFVAYTAFTHGKGFETRPQIPEMPKDFGYLATPAGGDQVLVVRVGRNPTGPVAITPPGSDVFRPTLARDGQGRLWVAWTQKQSGRWDIFARSYDPKADRLGKVLRLSDSPEPDLFVTAVADNTGRVWLAWQAFRGNQSDIVVARQTDDGFSEPEVVCDASGNQWTPALAASDDGRVAVAWDSYENGDYDVACRIWRNGSWGEPIVVAASARGEMRPSCVFDTQGRLWIAYEDASEAWGKDWGALEKTGTPLYQDRRIGVRVVANGEVLAPEHDVNDALAPPWPGRKKQQSPKLAFPRIARDAKGRIWLAVRWSKLGTRTSVGTAWFTHLTCFDGKRWTGDIPCPGTDNILDQRASLVPLPDGRLWVVQAADNRWALTAQLPNWFVQDLKKRNVPFRWRKIESRWPDRVNNEIVLAEVGPVADEWSGSLTLSPVDVPAKRKPLPEAAAEADQVAMMRSVRIELDGKPLQLMRGEFHRHTEISSDGGGDGALMDMWRYALDAASLDWIGNGDHDNGNGREYSWWITQKTTDLFHVPRAFAPMFTYERSCSYPDGHRNVVFAYRGVRTLPRLKNGRGPDLDDQPDAPRPHTPDTQMLYAYLRQFDGVCASHTSGTDMGTDWRDNDPKVEPIVEIYQGCRQNYEMPDAPRAPTADYAIGGYRPFGFVSLALLKGYKLGFQASSDHVSTHISYCNVWAEAPTRQAILDAMKKRHVYGSTDNILAEFYCGKHFMGDEFTTSEKPIFRIRLVGTEPFAKVHIIKDNVYVHTIEPNDRTVEFTWTDMDPKPGKTSYYYVRGEQVDGELVWVSPMWITYRP
ncbi:MAG: DUF3604 domain-containing protein [Planctomycetota bacterium]|nr:MAG: DUF3604 domain-containing protein [Planctomycetota bacterium]